MANPIYQRNVQKAKESRCFGCDYLHVGREVDHNHCNSPEADYTSDKRVSGIKLEDRCLERIQ